MTTIDWNTVPDVITKEQFYKLCHISKRTAMVLLRTGKVPCQYSGKQTRCYKIRKADVMQYMEKRELFPELYTVSKHWYDKRYEIKEAELPPEVHAQMRTFYATLLSEQPDMMTLRQVEAIIGYNRSTIARWHKSGDLLSLKVSGVCYIPKIFLIEFFCSFRFRSIAQKSPWHRSSLRRFHLSYKKQKQSTSLPSAESRTEVQQ